jgi:TRAP-type C4-dicarboxylate transport system permease small subunit
MSSELKWRWTSLLPTMALLLMTMIALVFTNAVMRCEFDSGLRPSIELLRMGLGWLVMPGAAVLLRRDEHLALTEVLQRAFPRLVRLLRRLA